MTSLKLPILVTDDARVNRMIVKKHLEKLGYEVLEAENGVEAIEVLKNQAVALIFMDIEMPEMDGFTASETIRRENISRAPIIALTGHDAEADKALLRDKGINQLFNKPISADDLNRIRRHYLDS